MITTVTGRNQVTIPAQVVHQLEIQRGARLDWRIGADGCTVEIRVLQSRGALAREVMGIGRRYVKTAEDPIAEFVAQRGQDDDMRQQSLEQK